MSGLESASLLREIQARIKSRDFRVTLQAADRSIRRHISVREIEQALLAVGAEIIENYQEDPRGPSCLVLGFTERAEPLHVQCAYPPAIAIVTAYKPEIEEWTNWRIKK